jgi:tetratricopeptide (TPR) repeat protein
MVAHHYLAALELARAAKQDTTALTPAARTALQAAVDRAYALNAFAPATMYYRAALALWPQDAQRQRSGLLRLLGTVLFEAGDLSGAEAALAEGAEAAAAAGLPAMQARIDVLLAEARHTQSGSSGEALAECQAATAILRSAGDLEGLAEAWQLAGKLRFWLGDAPAAGQAFERAIAYAGQSGNRRARTKAISWLVATHIVLPIPAGVAIARAEQLLQEAGGEPWGQARGIRGIPCYGGTRISLHHQSDARRGALQARPSR